MLITRHKYRESVLMKWWLRPRRSNVVSQSRSLTVSYNSLWDPILDPDSHSLQPFPAPLSSQKRQGLIPALPLSCCKVNWSSKNWASWSSAIPAAESVGFTFRSVKDAFTDMDLTCLELTELTSGLADGRTPAALGEPEEQWIRADVATLIHRSQQSCLLLCPETKWGVVQSCSLYLTFTVRQF